MISLFACIGNNVYIVSEGYDARSIILRGGDDKNWK